MELNDLNSISRSKKINKLLDTRFGWELDLSNLSESKAERMMKHADNEMKAVKENDANFQTNKRYLASKLAKECIESWLIENNLNIVEKDDEDPDLEPGDGKINKQQNDPKNDGKRNVALRALVGTENFSRARRALEMYKQGKTVPPMYMQALMPIIDMIDEIMASGMANVRMMQMINKRSKKTLGISESKLTEGKMESAELVLAAKDMVDRIQGMLEDVGEMMNEDLLPLVDSIRDEMGNDKATSFENAARGTLESFMDSVTQARSDMDNASRILTDNADTADVGVDLSADDEEIDISAPDADAEVDIDAGEEGQEGTGEFDREERI